MNKGKIIVLAAPSGCGKSTIVGGVMQPGDIELGFAISATTRQPREGETDGVNYYFISEEEFRTAIAEDRFVEYEEVYPGRFYGTLHSEIERITSTGSNIILDLDVNGALRVKEIYGERVLTLFIEPPSLETLRQRLVSRGTETPDVIEVRINRAAYELSRAPEFDYRIVNDKLDVAVAQTHALIKAFTVKTD